MSSPYRVAALLAALISGLSWPGAVSRAAEPAELIRPLQDPPPPGDSLDDRPYWRRNLFRRFFSDQKFLFTTWWPAEARRPLFTFPLVASLGAAVSAGGDGPDIRLERAISSWSTGRATGMAQGLSRAGDAEVGVLLLGTSYLISRWSGNERMSRATSLATEALLSAGLYSTTLKHLTRRTRPTDGPSAFLVERQAPGQELNSFPSGHTMGAFAVATVFAEEFRDRRWVAWVAYGAAGLIGGSRVALGRHFPADVAAGALLGRSLGWMVVQRDLETWMRPERQRTLSPIYDPKTGGAGLAMTWRW